MADDLVHDEVLLERDTELRCEKRYYWQMLPIVVQYSNGKGGEKRIAGHYLPVPVWNSSTGMWEPIDFRQGQRVGSWPDGFDPATLPDPEYHDRDRVQFVCDETCACEGVIRRVPLRGGIYGPLEDREEVIKHWYLDPDTITYLVTVRVGSSA